MGYALHQSIMCCNYTLCLSYWIFSSWGTVALRISNCVPNFYEIQPKSCKNKSVTSFFVWPKLQKQRCDVIFCLFLFFRWAFSSYLQKFWKLSDQRRSWTSIKPVKSSSHHFNIFPHLATVLQSGLGKSCFVTKLQTWPKVTVTWKRPKKFNKTKKIEESVQVQTSPNRGN